MFEDDVQICEWCESAIVNQPYLCKMHSDGKICSFCDVACAKLYNDNCHQVTPIINVNNKSYESGMFSELNKRLYELTGSIVFEMLPLCLTPDMTNSDAKMYYIKILESSC